jgi:hypothetical protein
MNIVGLDMIKRVKFLLIAVLFMVAPVSLFSQVTFRAEAPSVVETNERFRLVFVVNSSPSGFNPPEITGFDILAGPTSSTMSSTSIVNGKRTETYQVSYTYVLEARKEGVYTIPSASVSVEGNNYTSDPLKIEVVKGSVKEGAEDDKSGIAERDLFLRVTLDKRNVVLGEPVTVTVKLYSDVSVAGFEDVRFPSFDGFWSQETETPRNIEFVRENIDGRIYNAALLRRYVLIPQTSGDLAIDGASMVCQVQIRENRSASRSVFDDFFDSYTTVRKRVEAPPVVLNVDRLPEGAPSSFDGAVGTYAFDAYLSRDSVNANEALSYIVEVRGSGNINLVDAPEPSIPSSFEVYDVKVSEELSPGRNGSSGVKKFEYPLIARAPGNYMIPSLEFSYYDITSRDYVTLSTGERNIYVGGAADEGEGDQGSFTRGVNRQSVRSIADDIRFIKTNISPPRVRNLFFAGTVSYYITLIVFLLIFLMVERYLAKRIERNRDIAGVRNRRAVKVARKRLRKAVILMKEDNYNGFYEELHRALLGYISDKMNLSMAELSRDRIEESLVERGVGEQYIKELTELLGECEYARYSPDQGEGRMDNHYKDAINLISSLEL